MDEKLLSERMDKAIEALKSSLAGIRASRADPGFLRNVNNVEAYNGSKQNLNQVAYVSVRDNKTLLVQVYDISLVKAVEKALTISNLGISMVTDGNNITVHLPELTEERRKELIKLASQALEDAKVAIRNIRRSFLDEIRSQEKNAQLSKDDAFRQTKSLQEDVDKVIKYAESIFRNKEKDILGN